MNTILAKDIQVIVTTYNRPVQILGFAQSLRTHFPNHGAIIIIDSSTSINDDLASQHELHYLKTSHQNQPYQRYLGYKKATSKWLLFFDDDMEIIDEQFVEKIISKLTTSNFVGLGLYFEDKHDQTFLKSMESSVFKSKNEKPGFLTKTFRAFTGYPILESGKVGWNGLRGKQPLDFNSTEWFSGGAFLAKKEFLYQNFNFSLFDLYEKRLGKGEDLIISYTLSKQGMVKFYPEKMLLHNDQQNSVYTNNHFQLAQRVLFSRLFLSYEFARLNKFSFNKTRFLYFRYSFFRTLSVFFNYLIKRNDKQKELLKGNFAALKMAFYFKYVIETNTESYWPLEAEKELKIKLLQENNAQ